MSLFHYLLSGHQVGYFIAGLAVYGFKPSFVYALAVDFILGITNLLLTYHRERLTEIRADFESLFSGITFTSGEHQKMMNVYQEEQKSEEVFKKRGCWARFLCSDSLLSTHPSYQDRVNMIQTSLVHYSRENTGEHATVSVDPENREEEQSETSALLSAA